MIRTAFLLPAAALLLAASTTLAREFWLEVPGYRLPAAGATRNLRLFSGQNFQGEKWSGKAQRVRRLVRFGPGASDSTNLTPQQPGPADSLQTSIAFQSPGTHLVALHTTAAFTTMSGAAFNAYLKEEGLSYALFLRGARKQDTLTAREAYRRCAKTLVQVGPGGGAAAADTAFRRVLGAPLELVPEQNPYLIKAGGALTVRVLRAGKPVAGAQVQVWERQATEKNTRRVVLHANQSGRLLLRLSGAGPYLLACVEMIPMPKPVPADLPPADWLSTWASLTFAGPTSMQARR